MLFQLQFTKFLIHEHRLLGKNLKIQNDFTIGGRYFEFKWTSFLPECGGTIRDQEHGSFKSPGYPQRYPDNRDCVWTIHADYGKRIMFQFATLNLEHHPNCSYDFLKVNSRNC